MIGLRGEKYIFKMHLRKKYTFEQGKKYFLKYTCEQWLGQIRQHGNQMTGGEEDWEVSCNEQWCTAVH